jgi:MGT family glycosyltransferase
MQMGKKIMFFTLPAYSHVYPTLEIARALVEHGYEVRYYSFSKFQTMVESTGATYVECDSYLPPSREDLVEKIERDFGTLVEMTCDTTVNMENMIKEEMAAYEPDLILSETMCFWGKLFAHRFHVPYICIVPGLANNIYTEKLKKLDWNRFLILEFEMPRINNKMQLLQAFHYQVRGYTGLTQNDDYTNAIVCTSRGIQPREDTFKKKFAFVGPCIPEKALRPRRNSRKRILISLNLSETKRDRFYKACVDALGGMDMEVILSVPESFDESRYSQAPANFRIRKNVNPVDVLPDCDLFFSKCAVAELNQSMYFGVPMLLYPEQTDEKLAAMRAEELGVGHRIKKLKAEEIKAGVQTLLETVSYKEKAKQVQDELRQCGGSEAAVKFVDQVIEKKTGYLMFL